MKRNIVPDSWHNDIDSLIAGRLNLPVRAVKSLSVGQILEKGANSVPDKTAIVVGERRMTYKELNDMCDALVVGLSELGIRKGDRVAIYMKNSFELVVSFYALQKLGAIVIWINPQYRKMESEFILRNSGAKGVFIFRECLEYDYLDSILNIKENLPELELIVVVGEGGGVGVHGFSDLIKGGLGKGYAAPGIDTQNDLSMLIYTSGSTGEPKGTMITHYQAVRGGFMYSVVADATSEDIFLGFLPMCHSYGCGAILIQPILLEATAVLIEKFDTEEVFQIIEKEKTTVQPAAPAHYILELDHPNRKSYDLTSLRACLTGGQILPEGLVTRVQKEMGIYLTTMWGASEVGPGLGLICPYPSPLDIREKYVGQPVPGTSIKVVDQLTRRELPDGQVGELAMSGWHVMKGYWKMPEETGKQIVNGWFFTGDLVSRGENGFVRVHGRIKDLINRGGYKIYPFELEAVICDYPKVDQVCVVATPNPILGENCCVCIIPIKGESVSLSEIREFLMDKVARQKLPDELCILSEFPKLPGGFKTNKFGKGGLAELAGKDENRERYRK